MQQKIWCVINFEICNNEVRYTHVCLRGAVGTELLHSILINTKDFVAIKNNLLNV